MAETVLVTGAAGFIGSYVVRELQEEGYHVRAAVRDPNDETKVGHLTNPAFNTNKNKHHPVELVRGELANDECWLDLVRGCTYVIHLASPFPLDLSHGNEELERIAVDGTLSVLRACEAADCVKRVVMTSSIAAVMSGDSKGQTTFTEDDWCSADDKSVAKNSYIRSKILAEKAAWKFMDSMKSGKNFDLSVINPAAVIGPPLGKNCSGGLVVTFKRIMEREMQVIPKINVPLVDVRDVATAHVRAMTLPEAAGNRHIVSNYNMWLADLVKVVNAEFKPQGYNISTKTSPEILMKMKSLTDNNSRFILPILGKITLLDNIRMRQVLGITPRNIKDSVIDMAYGLIENGIVKKAKGYNGIPNKSIAEQTVITSL